MTDTSGRTVPLCQQGGFIPRGVKRSNQCAKCMRTRFTLFPPLSLSLSLSISHFISLSPYTSIPPLSLLYPLSSLSIPLILSLLSFTLCHSLYSVSLSLLSIYLSMHFSLFSQIFLTNTCRPSPFLSLLIYLHRCM